MTPLERADELLGLAAADSDGLVSHRIIQARQLVQFEQSERLVADGSGRVDARCRVDGGDELAATVGADVPAEMNEYLEDLAESGAYPSKAEAIRDLLALGRLVRECDARELLEDYADMEVDDE